MNHDSLNILFSDKTGPPIFRAAMPCDRIKFLLKTLTFHDPEERKGKWPYNCFSASRCSTLTHQT